MLWMGGFFLLAVSCLICLMVGRKLENDKLLAAGLGTVERAAVCLQNAPMQQPLQQGTGGREALVQVEEGLGRGTSQHMGSTRAAHSATKPPRAKTGQRGATAGA